MDPAYANLWDLLYTPTIDRHDLTRALIKIMHGQDFRTSPPDYETLQLICEASQVLAPDSKTPSFHSWIKQWCATQGLDCDVVKFPHLKERLVSDLRREQILQYLRELSTRLCEPTTITIGGSVALTLQNFPRKPTDDIDLVDEIPLQIRVQYQSLRQLEKSYGIALTHFQAHYLPAGWQQRIRSLGVYQNLAIYLVDAYDVIASKCYSGRQKDLDNLRHFLPVIDKDKLYRRLESDTLVFWNQDNLRTNLVRNWFILYGEEIDL